MCNDHQLAYIECCCNPKDTIPSEWETIIYFVRHLLPYPIFLSYIFKSSVANIGKNYYISASVALRFREHPNYLREIHKLTGISIMFIDHRQKDSQRLFGHMYSMIRACSISEDYFLFDGIDMKNTANIDNITTTNAYQTTFFLKSL
jgi:hypothetical protein